MNGRWQVSPYMMRSERSVWGFRRPQLCARVVVVETEIFSMEGGISRGTVELEEMRLTSNFLIQAIGRGFGDEAIR